MYYECYGYHSAPTEPTANDLTDKIFGLELEIDDYSQTVEQILDNAIDNDILTVPQNEECTRGLKVVENDSSVFKEIILPADEKKYLLKRVKVLNQYDFTDEFICNSPGTSAHIHINREYLRKIGVTETSIFKLFELYSPIIFAISGRTREFYIRWANTRSTFETTNINWEQRAKQITHLTPSSDRYTLVNCCNTSTIELRGFSNVSNFDYDTIKLYLDFVDFCLTQAESMRGLLYVDEYKRLLSELENWFKRSYPAEYNYYNLRTVFKQDLGLHRLKDRLKMLNEKYSTLRGYQNYIKDYDLDKYDVGEVLIKLWRVKDDINLYRVTMTQHGLKNAINKAVETYNSQKRSYYWEYYRTLNHDVLVGEE